MYNIITNAESIKSGGDKDKKMPPQDENQKFGNWTGQMDTKVAAKDLMNRGLKGADQLVYENQKTDTADNITNKNQSDWKISAIQNIVGNARKYGLRSPESIEANKDVLIDNPKWKEAINHPAFAQIHENFWPVVKGIIKDQWAKYDSEKASKTSVAQK